MHNYVHAVCIHVWPIMTTLLQIDTQDNDIEGHDHDHGKTSD